MWTGSSSRSGCCLAARGSDDMFREEGALPRLGVCISCHILQNLVLRSREEIHDVYNSRNGNSGRVVEKHVTPVAWALRCDVTVFFIIVVKLVFPLAKSRTQGHGHSDRGICIPCNISRRRSNF